MANDFEMIAKSLMSNNSHNGGLEKIIEILKTEEGRALLNLAAQTNSNPLKTAAASAMNGDSESAKKAFMEFMSTKEGAALASRLAAILGGNVR